MTTTAEDLKGLEARIAEAMKQTYLPELPQIVLWLSDLVKALRKANPHIGEPEPEWPRFKVVSFGDGEEGGYPAGSRGGGSEGPTIASIRERIATEQRKHDEKILAYSNDSCFQPTEGWFWLWLGDEWQVAYRCQVGVEMVWSWWIITIGVPIPALEADIVGPRIEVPSTLKQDFPNAGRAAR